MNLGDKLAYLRKRKGLSQEELGGMLNVTRQTVSKWELGQTTPDTNNLIELSKILNIDFNKLIDNETIIDDNFFNTSNAANNQVDIELPKSASKNWMIILVIGILIGSIIFIAIDYISDKKEKLDNSTKLFNVILNLFEIPEKLEQESFNSALEYETGTKTGISVSSLLDDIITNNKKNENNKIVVVFLDFNSSNPNEIKELKKKINRQNNYEVSLDYDNKGYANKITIEEILEEDNVEIDSYDIKFFNTQFEMYAGTEYGVSISNLLDKIITNNKTNSIHTISVVYGNVNTTNEVEIRNLKKSLDKWTEYEVIVDYDDLGFVNRITIE